MWRNRVFIGAVLLLLLVIPGMASAALTISDMDSVSFSSDLEADKTITLDSFNTVGGTLTLTDVLVEFSFSGSCDIGVDSDDTDEEFDVNARIIRIWYGLGPGLAPVIQSNIYTTGSVHLGMDNGDGGTLDTSAPDGTDFGNVAFVMGTWTSHTPWDWSPYETAGPGTVDFTIDVSTIVNDFQSSPDMPDAYQLDVENPLLTVYAKVTYTYTPEPATLALLGFGALGLVARRRRGR